MSRPGRITSGTGAAIAAGYQVTDVDGQGHPFRGRGHGIVTVEELLHRVGLEGLVDPAYESFQAPEHSGDTLILSPGFVEDAQVRDIAVVAWTINEPDDLGRMIALGVRGINTDHPDRLVDMIAAD